MTTKERYILEYMYDNNPKNSPTIDVCYAVTVCEKCPVKKYGMKLNMTDKSCKKILDYIVEEMKCEKLQAILK